MTVTVDWDNTEKTILHYHYIGKWTWDEYKAATSKAHELAASVDYPIDVIADFSKAPLLPANALGNFKSSWQTSPLNLGIVVLITNSALVERLASIFQRVNGNYANKFKVVTSLDDAYTFMTNLRNRTVI